MPSIIETAKCEGHELALLLKHLLPHDLSKLWHTTEDILVMLRTGGISSYTKQRIGHLLRTQKRISFERNEFNKVTWLCFNEEREYSDPSQQSVAFKEKERPQIVPNYFTNGSIPFKYIKTQTTADTTMSATTTNTTTPAAVNANNNNNNTASANIINNDNDNNNNNNTKLKQQSDDQQIDEKKSNEKHAVDKEDSSEKVVALLGLFPTEEILTDTDRVKDRYGSLEPKDVEAVKSYPKLETS